MTDYWDFDYYASIVAVTGVGDTLSEGVGAVHAAQSWDFDYVSMIVSVTGAGDTLSSGAGAVGTATVWDFDYWDGVNSATGAGNTDSAGVGSATAENALWYDIVGVVDSLTAAAGAGDTLSGSGGAVGVFDPIVSVTGAGDTSSAGVGAVGVVLPPGAIRLSPYWAPGDAVFAYRLEEWLGSYEARLGAGPGPVTQIGYGDPDTTVAFGGLEPGQYVAVQGRKRVHFMVTP